MSVKIRSFISGDGGVADSIHTDRNNMAAAKPRVIGFLKVEHDTTVMDVFGNTFVQEAPFYLVTRSDCKDLFVYTVAEFERSYTPLRAIKNATSNRTPKGSTGDS